MDITDCKGNARVGIKTVPVRHGKGATSAAALACSVVLAGLPTGASLAQHAGRLAAAAGAGGGGGVGGGSVIGWGDGTMPGLTSSLDALVMDPGARRVLLSASGSAMLVRRTYAIWRARGEDSKLANRAIEESLISVLLVLASFL